MPATTTTAQDLPLDMIIFGGAGDLAMRKLLPALYMAHMHGNLPSSTRIIASGRQAYSRGDYIAFVESNSRPFISESNFDAAAWTGFLALLEYAALDVQNDPDFNALARLSRPGAERVFYLATAPALFTTICDKLSASGLVDDNARVVLEKPLGRDLASAVEINEAVGKHFNESQIYRIDHYLGKETVQNLMVLRFGNSILEPLWRAPNISSVQITVAEDVGVGSRAGFYDSTGAMRDMVQNHLLQLLCIVAMEPPVSLSPDAVRDEKLKVLRSLRRFSLAGIARDTVRGQYVRGAVDSKEVKGYLEESNVPAGSNTETFVALRTYVDTWRWSKVPFFLRTGKHMSMRETEIAIRFKAPPYAAFQNTPVASLPPNWLVLRIAPDDGISLQFEVKRRGAEMELAAVKMDFRYDDYFPKMPNVGYETLIHDIMQGDQTLFMRADMVEQAWRIVQPVLDAWAKDRPKDMPMYKAGSEGPAEADSLLTNDDRRWRPVKRAEAAKPS